MEVKISYKDSKKYFGPTKNIRYSDVSLYSTTPYEQSIYISDILDCYYNNTKTKILTDGNACIGGNTWSFANKVHKVNAVELNKLHCDMLSNNINNDKVTIINDNYLNVYDKIDNDIIFLDPPWGGKDYKDGVELFYLDNNNVKVPFETLIDPISYHCEVLILKIPTNTNVQVMNKINNNNFLYKEIITIKSKKDDPMYILVILSHIKKIKDIPIKSFDKIGYRFIKVL